MSATTTEQHLDQAKVAEFAGRALSDVAGAMTTIFCAIGDRTGLTRALAEGGPATSEGLALRAGINERYTREWLRGMFTAGYLEYDARSGRFSVPPEHVPVLAEEGGATFFGGVYQELLGALPVVPEVIRSFRDGGGVAQDAYGADIWEGMERFTHSWFEHLLLPEWMPAAPEIDAKLRRGAALADIGCGAGQGLLKLAHAYPDARFVGYDAFPGQLERARENAVAAGIDPERVRFELLDASTGLPERYDVITTFDVVHDAVDPRGLLRAIRDGLAADGRYLMLEMNSSDRFEEDAGPLGTLFYGFSVLYCMTTSLAHGGEGLGTCGMPESKVRELCAEAGFSDVRRVPIENPFNSLYEARA